MLIHNGTLQNGTTTKRYVLKRYVTQRYLTKQYVSKWQSLTKRYVVLDGTLLNDMVTKWYM
jgi:hypothetical protein